jgi:macrolide transport system ATP-binding/permease protein
VLAGVSLKAYPGQRLGIVGENGAGKSTLLGLLTGAEEADSGEVVRTDDVGFLHQESPFPENGSVAEVVEAALAEARGTEQRLAELARQLERRPEDTEALAAYGEALGEAEARGVWDADRRAEMVLAGLGLESISKDRALASLSGGERSRLALAALLMRRPRALLLDEPTNHLDDEALAFLEEHLRGVSGVVVVASHDRVFLDAVCTGILDLDPAREGELGGASRRGATLYGGAYSDYLRAKRAEWERWEQEWREQQAEISRLKAAVSTSAREVSHSRPMKDRNKPAYDRHGEQVQRGVSRRVRNARMRLDRLLAHRIPKPLSPLRFGAELTADAPAEGTALSLGRVRVPGRLAFDHLDVSAADRLLVTGPNGAGKSTLLAVLAGLLEPAEGTVYRRGLRVGFLEQDV